MDVNFRGTQYSILEGAKASCRNCGQHLGNEGPSIGRTEARGKVVPGSCAGRGAAGSSGTGLAGAGSGRGRGMGALGWEPVGALQLAHSSGEEMLVEWPEGTAGPWQEEGPRWGEMG